MKTEKQTLHKKEDGNEIKGEEWKEIFFKLRKNTGQMLVKKHQLHQKEVDTDEENWMDGGEEASSLKIIGRRARSRWIKTDK